MNRTNFAASVLKWAKRNTTKSNPALLALLDLYDMLLEESCSEPSEEDEQSLTRKINNILALLTLSPLQYFLAEIIDQDIELTSDIASLKLMEQKLGHFPEQEEDADLAHYLAGVSMDVLCGQMTDLNLSPMGAEALRLWQLTGLPGYEIPNEFFVNGRYINAEGWVH